MNKLYPFERHPDGALCTYSEAWPEQRQKLARSLRAQAKAIVDEKTERKGGWHRDNRKAAYFDELEKLVGEHGEPVGATKDAGSPSVKAAPAAPIRRRTAAMILNGEEYRDDEPTPNPKQADSYPLTPTQAAAFRMLEASVATGNTEAMTAALLTFCEVAGVNLGKSHRLTAEQILNGEVLPYQGPRIKRGGPTAEQILNGEGAAHKWSVVVTGDDEDEDDEMDDATEAGAAPNLALTADQAYYWERLQAVVSGAFGISDSLETAARNFYNSVSIGL